MIATKTSRPPTKSLEQARNAQGEVNRHVTSSSAPVQDFLATAITLLTKAQSAWANAEGNSVGTHRTIERATRACEGRLKVVRWLQETHGQSRAAIEARYPGLVDSWMKNRADVPPYLEWEPTGESPAPDLPNLLQNLSRRGRIDEITLQLLGLQLTPDDQIIPTKTQS
jgi:hypothetical protein